MVSFGEVRVVSFALNIDCILASFGLIFTCASFNEKSEETRVRVLPEHLDRLNSLTHKKRYNVYPGCRLPINVAK